MKDVKKALDICNKHGNCEECPYYDIKFKSGVDCVSVMHEDALDILNTKDKEIELQSKLLGRMMNMCARSESKVAKLQKKLKTK